MRRLMVGVRSFLFVLPLAACADAARNDGIELKHVFGETSVPRRANASCSQANGDRLGESYLREIAEFLMEANAAVFQGDYSPDTFCFSIETSGSLNASANASGSIVFLKGLVKAATSDAEIGAIMAHELEHITMQHGFRQNPKLEASLEWPVLNARRSELEREISQIKDRLESRSQRVFGLEMELATRLPNAMAEQRQSIMQRLASLKETARHRLPTPARTMWLDFTDASDDITGLLSIRHLRGITVGATPVFAVNLPIMHNLRSRLSSLSGAVRTQVEHLVGEVHALAVEADQMTRPLTEALDRQMLAEIAELESQNSASVNYTLPNLESQISEILATRAQLVSDDELANWSEAEADEVGFEFFIRAGLKASAYTWLQRREVPNCQSQLSRGEVPERGRGTHPAHCWRMYDVTVLEATAHEREYAPLLRDANRENVLDEKLRELQESL